jgi:hypothetical protein
MSSIEKNVDHSYIRIKEETPGMWQDFYTEYRPFGRVSMYKNDFLSWVPDEWTVTEVGTSLQKLADAKNGVLELVSGGTENDGNNCQLGGSGDSETVGESFKPESGRNMWFEVRLKADDVTEHDFFVGFSIQDTAVCASYGADLIGFRTDDGDALLDCTSASTASGATSSLNVATLVNDTFIILGFKVIGTEKIEFYVNNVLKATHTTSIPSTEMKLTMAQLTGEGNAATLSIDYIVAAQDR